MKHGYLISIVLCTIVSICGKCFIPSLLPSHCMYIKGPFAPGFYINKYDFSHADVKVTQIFKAIYREEGSLIIRLPFAKLSGFSWKIVSLTSDQKNQQILESNYVETVPKCSRELQPIITNIMATELRPYLCVYSYETEEYFEEVLMYTSQELSSANYDCNLLHDEQYAEQIFQLNFENTGPGRFIFYLMNEYPLKPYWYSMDKYSMDNLKAEPRHAQIYKFIIDVHMNGSGGMALGTLHNKFMDYLPNSSWAYFQPFSS